MIRKTLVAGLALAALCLTSCGRDDSKTIKFSFESAEDQGSMGRLWQPVLCRQDVGEKVHSQLLRLIVFASTMAQMNDLDWKVVNLVSRTQWKNGGTRWRKGYDFENPREFIPQTVRDHFQFLSWEELYNAILAKEPRATEIAEYMQKKTANLSRAFDFE